MKIFFHASTSEAKDTAEVQSPVKVCMHVLGEVRDDDRVLREASALVEAGIAVCIVDIEGDSTRPIEEDISGIRVKHIIKPAWYRPTDFRLWYFLRSVQVRVLVLLRLVQTSADIYHAHELKLPELYSTYWLWKGEYHAHPLHSQS